jgi:2-polyprenyl-6-hydroxyphenyl methylase/3-demethylubiquinone-9 3-methyltransferase
VNRNPKSYLFAIVGAEHILKLLPKGTHDYAKFIRPSELAEWLRHANLNLLKMTGMLYNPLTKNYSLNERDVSVNYLMFTRKPL